jgi:uncharacterized protein (DUF608 family)
MLSVTSHLVDDGSDTSSICAISHIECVNSSLNSQTRSNQFSYLVPNNLRDTRVPVAVFVAGNDDVLLLEIHRVEQWNICMGYVGQKSVGTFHSAFHLRGIYTSE